MMDMRYPGHALQQYQDETKRKAQMPGVTRPSFRCAKCGCSKGVSGRKRLSVGWLCAECHQAREYRKAIKEAS